MKLGIVSGNSLLASFLVQKIASAGHIGEHYPTAATISERLDGILVDANLLRDAEVAFAALAENSFTAYVGVVVVASPQISRESLLEPGRFPQLLTILAKPVSDEDLLNALALLQAPPAVALPPPRSVGVGFPVVPGVRDWFVWNSHGEVVDASSAKGREFSDATALAMQIVGALSSDYSLGAIIEVASTGEGCASALFPKLSGDNYQTVGIVTDASRDLVTIVREIKEAP